MMASSSSSRLQVNQSEERALIHDISSKVLRRGTSLYFTIAWNLTHVLLDLRNDGPEGLGKMMLRKEVRNELLDDKSDDCK